jgi:hypothetical protein
VIRGFFSPTHLGNPEPAVTAVPLLDAFLYLPLTDTHISLQFLVDTGADMTVLHPRDSLRLIADEVAWDKLRAQPAETLGGAGAGLPYYLVPVVIGLEHEDGMIDSLPLTIGIGEPAPAIEGHESLLGRDVLAHYWLSFIQPESLVLEAREESTAPM